MKHLFRFLCVMAMLCYSVSAFSETASLWVGDSYTFNFGATSGSVSSTVTWYISSFNWEYNNSSDQQYFSMTSSGKTATVTLKQFFTGTKSIKLKYTYNTYDSWSQKTTTEQRTNTYYIECNKVTVSLYPTTLNLSIGASQTLQWQFSPASSNPAATVTFSSSNTNVATVDFNGKVTAKSAGTATITATTNYSTTATCKVTVSPILATSISLDQTEMSLPIGASQTLTATVLPANASNKAVTWKSSDAAIATVDANGKVTGVSTGNATITATTKDGSNLSASCAVTVTGITATAVQIDRSEVEMRVGQNVKLTATVLPEGAAQRVTWSSSDPSVAKVVGGTVYALDMGECIITAKTLDGSNKTADCLILVYPNQAQGGSGDVNGDGLTDIEDVNILIQMILNSY